MPSTSNQTNLMNQKNWMPVPWKIFRELDSQAMSLGLDVACENIFKAIEDTKSFFFELEVQKKKISGKEKWTKTNEQTRYIKTLFVLLAGKERWRVYANGLDEDKSTYHRLARLLHITDPEKYSKFKNKEWMLDVHWYLEKDDDQSQRLRPSKEKPPEDRYCPIKFPLAVECEWGAPHKIKYDYQKLLFCNAQLRLLIFRIDAEKVEQSIAEKLQPYFMQSIEGYGANEPGTTFGFAAFLTHPARLKEQNILYAIYQKQL